ncbi:MAG: hypothetical protein HYT08_03090 [Candidatus Levybacteria bacterium]|nr:hypothetical protein [Candidatus Levybacteria bacterium]
MVETKVGYPYVKGKYGIPFKDLPVNIRSITKGGSGSLLHYDIRRDSIEIEDEEFSGYHVSAKVVEDTFIAAVHTRRYITGERHPDLFARRFLIFAYEYFLSNGYEINTYSSYWIPSLDKFASTNYSQYSRMLKKGIDPEDAAKATWTGRLAGEFGFTEIESMAEDESGGLRVVFKKPDQG